MLGCCCCVHRIISAYIVVMADGAVSGQPPLHLPPANSNDGGADHEKPLDFSVKRDHVTPMTSSQTAVTSLAVAAAAPPPPVLFPQLIDPTLVSALSAAGLLRPPNPVTLPSCRPSEVGHVTEQVRAYVQSKIAEEQRRLLIQRASMSSSSSPSVDSSIDRAASPVRSSPTSTTSHSAGFDAVPPRWPTAVQPPPPPPSEEETPASAAAVPGGRKRSVGSADIPAPKDGHYWERRRKNNEAAKRSRDARRAKEEEVALRASILEQENRQLRVELTAFRLEVARLSELLCRQVSQQSSASNFTSTTAASAEKSSSR